jgi:eukaryotic translation initiation factor 2C
MHLVDVRYRNLHFYVLVAVISPSEKTLPARLNMEIITHLQTIVAPGIFTPRAVYDGRKNIFAARELPFTDGVQEVRPLHPSSTLVF